VRFSRVAAYQSRPVLRPTQRSIKWIPWLFHGAKWLDRSADHPSHLVPKDKNDYSYVKKSPSLYSMVCYRATLTFVIHSIENKSSICMFSSLLKYFVGKLCRSEVAGVLFYLTKKVNTTSSLEFRGFTTHAYKDR